MGPLPVHPAEPRVLHPGGLRRALILLAQTRQDDRDRAQSEADRQTNARTQADTEFLARELASVRLALADVVTADDLRAAVERVTGALDNLTQRLDRLDPAAWSALVRPG